MNIELSQVARTFGKNKAVDGVSLDAGPGVLGLLGPNGAGKTSLLRMLATVLPPSSGEIRLLDRDPRRIAERREIRRRLGLGERVGERVRLGGAGAKARAGVQRDALGLKVGRGDGETEEGVELRLLQTCPPEQGVEEAHRFISCSSRRR